MLVDFLVDFRGFFDDFRSCVSTLCVKGLTLDFAGRRGTSEGPHTSQKMRKSTKNRPESASRARCAQTLSLESLFERRRAAKGSPERPRDVLQASPGHSGEPLGRSWGRSGSPQGPPWSAPARSQDTSGTTPEPEGAPERLRERFCIDFRCPGEGPGSDFRSIWASTFTLCRARFASDLPSKSSSDRRECTQLTVQASS